MRSKVMQKSITFAEVFYSCIKNTFLLFPLVLLGFFLSKLSKFSCIDTTSKAWMILVSIFIFAYVIKYYWGQQHV